MHKIVEIETSRVMPYPNNPRKNDDAVEYVAESIKQFGFKVPILVNKEYVVIAGHTRLKAAEMLGLETVPCVVLRDLTPEQEKALRVADNKVSELSSWDFDKLLQELEAIEGIDMEPLGFSTEPMAVQVFDDAAELDLEAFSEEAFDYECPHCGFKFNG